LGEPFGNLIKTWWEHIGNKGKKKPQKFPSHIPPPPPPNEKKLDPLASACSLSIKNSTHEIGVGKENVTKDTNSKNGIFSSCLFIWE
jgi:hypothetical protein